MLLSSSTGWLFSVLVTFGAGAGGVGTGWSKRLRAVL